MVNFVQNIYNYTNNNINNNELFYWNNKTNNA